MASDVRNKRLLTNKNIIRSEPTFEDDPFGVETRESADPMSRFDCETKTGEESIEAIENEEKIAKSKEIKECLDDLNWDDE